MLRVGCVGGVTGIGARVVEVVDGGCVGVIGGCDYVGVVRVGVDIVCCCVCCCCSTLLVFMLLLLVVLAVVLMVQ